MTNKIKTILVDDHKMFLDGLYNLLKTNDVVEIKTIAKNGLEAIKQINNKKDIELVISDISMPQMDGLEMTKKIKKIYPNIKVIIVSMHKESTIIHKLIKNNVDGYLLKNASIDELIKAIKTVFKGEKYFSKEVMNHYLNSMFAPDKIKKSEVRLSAREKEVLLLIANEYTNNEIAEKLFLSPYTVETHRKNILHKINAKNTAGIVKYAIQHNLI